MRWKEPSLGWKLFAGLSLALLVGGLLIDSPKQPFLPWLDWVGLPIELLVLLGLVSYAFSLRIGRPRAWRILSVLYPLWAIVSVIVAVIRTKNTFVEGPARMTGAATGVLLAIAVFYFDWLAIHRLSVRPSDTRP